MPSVVACPRCAGHIMIDTSVVMRLRCPLCQGDFSTDEIAAPVVAAVAMATPIDTPPTDSVSPTDSVPTVFTTPEPPSFSTDWADASATTTAAQVSIDADEWHYPGLQPACSEPCAEGGEPCAEGGEPCAEGREPCAADSAPEEVVVAAVETSLETTWCYPGFSSVASEAATFLVSKVVTTVIRHSWSYPGLAPWYGSEQVIESAETEVEEELDEADLGGIEAETDSAPADDGYALAPPAARQYTSDVSPARTSMASRSRKKKNEVNPVFLMIGVFGGGLLGLAIGYCILVAIGGQRADFAHLFYK